MWVAAEKNMSRSVTAVRSKVFYFMLFQQTLKVIGDVCLFPFYSLLSFEDHIPVKRTLVLGFFHALCLI